jgi:hypothetical protein
LLTQEKISQTAVKQQETQLPSINVQGLIWGGVFPQAIIDEKVVKKGDMVGEMRIVEIDKEGITVLFNNKEYVLSPSAGAGQKPTAVASQQPVLEDKQPVAGIQQPAINPQGGSHEN